MYVLQRRTVVYTPQSNPLQHENAHHWLSPEPCFAVSPCYEVLSTRSCTLSVYSSTVRAHFISAAAAPGAKAFLPCMPRCDAVTALSSARPVSTHCLISGRPLRAGNSVAKKTQKAPCGLPQKTSRNPVPVFPAAKKKKKKPSS